LLWLRAVTAFKRVSTGTINRFCGGLMIAAAALLATRDLNPQR
jgi:hypothetical protein